MIDYCVVQKVCNGRQWIHTTFTNLRKAVSDTAFPKFIELAILLILYLFRNAVLICAFKLYPLTLCWPVLVFVSLHHFCLLHLWMPCGNEIGELFCPSSHSFVSQRGPKRKKSYSMWHVSSFSCIHVCLLWCSRAGCSATKQEMMVMHSAPLCSVRFILGLRHLISSTFSLNW